jgi:FMN phosphatase YigB (HAD superfamily)
MLRAALVDVGGTLWPERLTAHVSADPCIEQLGRLLRGVDGALALARLRDELKADDGSLVQDTHGLLARTLRTLGAKSAELDAEPDVVAVRRALCAPAVPGVRLFPGAPELLAGCRAIGLRCVIMSNVQVRGAVEYWRDLRDLGVAQFVDAVVTSLDVGFRKPHPRFFEAALSEAGCNPAACVVVGNSEANDIEPAIALGMRAVRMAIEEPTPATSAAHAVASSLDDALSVISRWAVSDRLSAKTMTRQSRL